MAILIIYSLFTIIFFTLIKNFFFKKNFLIENLSKNSHNLLLKNDFKKPKFYLGGLYFLFILFFIFLDISQVFLACITLIYFVGLSSDLNILNSPKIRLILQILIIFLLVYGANSFVEETRIDIVDSLLANFYFKSIFTIFCFLVLINGLNFIDGVNLNLIGYTFTVLLCLNLIILRDNISFNYEYFQFLLISLIILAIFNYSSSIIMGDGGAYTIGLLLGFLLIKVANENYIVSPFYVLNVLWYPAFENLFSIIRKIKSNISISKSDNFHLHHLIYNFLNKNYKKKKEINNTRTGIIINCYNSIFIFTASIYSYHTLTLIFLLILNVLVYVFIYRYLYMRLYK